MKSARRAFLQLAAATAATPLLSRPGVALDYPVRPVRLIVGFPAGTSSDITARLIAQWLSGRLGQQFIVENRPGAGTNIATEAVAHAAPDGYTLLWVTQSVLLRGPKLSCSWWRTVTWPKHSEAVLRCHPYPSCRVGENHPLTRERVRRTDYLHTDQTVRKDIFLMTSWTPLFLMPNLRVIDGVGVDEAAIVNSDDARVREYCRQFPLFRKFILKFTDPFGYKKAPGIFLFQTGSPKSFHSMEAVSSFRDLIALSVIPLQRARSILHGHSFYTQYADYFDFYPWSFNDNNGHLVCSSPALSGLDEVKKFRGQSSPVLSPQDLSSSDLDTPLLQVLLERWRRRYGTSKPLWADIALFRSLNTAFAASKIPAGVDITQFHIGRSIALWVSAFEILVHTGKEDVRLFKIYDRIAAAPWKEKSLLRRSYKPYAKNTKEPLPCWIYGEIHQARNDYLHGNPISRRRLIVKESKRNLFRYAAPLYRMALTGFLPIPKPEGDLHTFSRARYNFIVNQSDIERALSTIRLSEKAYQAKRQAELNRVTSAGAKCKQQA